MAIEKMSLWSVDGTEDKLDKALAACCESGSFQFSSGAKQRSVNEQDPYRETLSKLLDLVSNLKISARNCPFDEVTLETPEEFTKYSDELVGRYGELSEALADISGKLDEHKRTDEYVKHLMGLDVSFKELFSMKYVKTRIGRLPADSEKKLGYYTKKCFVFQPFERNGEFVYGVYLVPNDLAEFSDEIMDALGFERARLPDYIEDNAEDADKKLGELIAEEETQKRKLEEELSYFIDNTTKELPPIMSKLKFKSECFELRQKAIISAGRFSFSGYAPTAESKKLSELLKEAGVSCDEIPIEHKNASDEVPVKLKNNIITRPFEMFIKMYGLPCYSGFDPTSYVAVTYMLMFGIMFGDVGQGLLISLLGLILTRVTKNPLPPIMTRLGIFSALFGCVYGSVFGIETIITPIYHRENIWHGVCKLLGGLGIPEHPENIFQAAMVVLIFALIVGAILILISIILNTVKNFGKKKIGEALFSVNGVCGAVVYAALLGGAGGTLLFGLNMFSVPYVICLIILPAVLIFLKAPLTSLIERRKTEFSIAEAFIDILEGAITFLSNTMSYLRIGGFVLSHAGFMLVVSQLAGTADPNAPVTVGTVITYIIGNLLVMGIEGLLSGIQVLRLEFYEVFSRFYDGNGKVFEPVSLDVNLEQI